jgi:uncharacterized protein YjlB
MCAMEKRIVAHLLGTDGAIPNHPRWPLLVYPGAVALLGPDRAAIFEDLFTKNGWRAAWRNGVFPFHHYHSNAHGERGVTVLARPGDVVLPAGTGHKKLSPRGRLGVVGAYPAGSRPDTCTPPFAGARKNAEAAAQVALPAADPVFGANGPLFEHWR